MDVLVCQKGDMADGSVRIVAHEGLEIGVIHKAGDYYAYLNRCPHQGGPACEGKLFPQVCDRIGPDGSYLGQTYNESDMHIVCPWHGYEYHLSDGTNVGDKTLRLRKYEVVQDADEIYVSL